MGDFKKTAIVWTSDSVRNSENSLFYDTSQYFLTISVKVIILGYPLLDINLQSVVLTL